MLALLCLAALAATASARVVSEPPLVLNGWLTTGRAAPNTTHTVRIAITAQNIKELERIALAVSDPRSPQYGEHLSREEVNQLTAPRPEHVTAVVGWLNGAGVAHAVNAEQGTITIRDSVAMIEALFRTQIQQAADPTTSQTVLRAGDFEIPAELEGAIATVFGMHGLPLPPRAAAAAWRASGGEPNSIPVTPDIINQAYNISGVKASGSLKNRQAVPEFLGDLVNHTDIRAFFKQFLPDLPTADAEIFKSHGTAGRQGSGPEADLDFEFIMGVAPGVKTEFFAQLGQDFCADMHNWTELLLSIEDLPLVHSVSYGFQDVRTANGCHHSDLVAIDANFAKLAARGITVIFGSGDAGSGLIRTWPPGNRPEPACSQSPQANATALHGVSFLYAPLPSAAECCSIAHVVGIRGFYAGWTYLPPTSPTGLGNCTVFSSISGNESLAGATSGLCGYPPAPPGPVAKLWDAWPASSPWVTAVGATAFLGGDPAGPEKAVGRIDIFGSGGGFSDTVGIPAWQEEAIAHYLRTVDPSTFPDNSTVEFTTSGRGTPDVAVLGTYFETFLDGQLMPAFGTSASTPTFAAIVSLLNEARLQAGKKPLGFLNPWLYQNADAFTDVTVGWDHNGRLGIPFAAGFNCSAGWDPITGLGTPNFPKLLAAALAAK